MTIRWMQQHVVRPNDSWLETTGGFERSGATAWLHPARIDNARKALIRVLYSTRFVNCLRSTAREAHVS